MESNNFRPVSVLELIGLVTITALATLAIGNLVFSCIGL